MKVIDQQTHEATAANLDNQFTTLATSGAQVLLLETTGAFCTQAMADIEKQTACGTRWSSCRARAGL